MKLIQRKKRRFVVALAMTSLFAGTTVQAQTALDDILKSKVLKVAVQTDSAPYGFVGTDLKPIGLDIDMANYIAKKLGVAVELVPVVSASRIPALQTKKADLVIATLGKNPERSKVIDFTSSYSPFFQAVFGPKSTSIKRFDDNNGTVAAFASGQVQFVALGASVAASMMTKNPQLATEYKLLIKESPNFIGVAKGEDKLKNKVNEVLDEAKKSGELDALSKKWLGRPAGDLPL